MSGRYGIVRYESVVSERDNEPIKLGYGPDPAREPALPQRPQLRKVVEKMPANPFRDEGLTSRTKSRSHPTWVKHQSLAHEYLRASSPALLTWRCAHSGFENWVWPSRKADGNGLIEPAVLVGNVSNFNCSRWP